jgi:Zn finger protein HypA/HybF involved in hydrogenase expression
LRSPSLEFKPGTLSLVCPYCGRTQKIQRDEPATIEEYSFEKALAGKKTVPFRALADNGKELRCSGCGAVTIVTVQSTRCPFCDSPVVLEEASEDVIAPESVLPFSQNRTEAREIFKKWLKSRWFAPGDLVRRVRRDGIDGVYLPYWTYDAETETEYDGQKGTHHYETERRQGKTVRVRKTSWESVSGRVRVSFDDVLVSASESLPPALLRQLEPWDLGELRSFQPSYLSGFLAERHGVDLEQGFQEAKQRMSRQIVQAVRSDIGGDEQRVYSSQTEHRNVRFKMLLLPLWISSFRYQNKVYRFIVNARTGEPTGERPYSVAKISLAAACALGVLGFLSWLF